MRICLVRCPSPFLIDERAFPPLGLMAVGTALKGHEVHIHDGPLDEVPMDYPLYGFGPTTPEYSYALEMKRVIKAHNPDARIVIGGSHVTLNTASCINDGFDCIVTGDGELVTEMAFANRMLELIHGEERPLDEYPIIDRNLLNVRDYHYRLNGIPATTMVTGRGCPYKCAFCCKNYKTVRLRSAEKVIEEIDLLHFQFGYTALVFPEDIFILNRKRTEAACARMKELEIIWRCLVRSDLIVKYGQPFVKMMAESGCVEVGMGVESGSDEILSIINKGETSATIRQGIKMLREEGIRVKGFFIVGLPGESPETLDETWMFLEDMQMDDVDIKIFQPYPGCPIWDNKEAYDIEWYNNLDYKDMFYKGRPREYHGNVYTSKLSNQEIVDAWIEMEGTYKRA